MVGRQLHSLLLAKGSQRNVPARKVGTALVFLLLLILQLLGQDVLAQPSCEIEPGSADCGGNPSDPGSVTPSGQPRYVANPIDLLTGNKYQRGDDFAAFASPLVYIRHYNTALVDQDVGLGYGWRDTYSLRLYDIEGRGYRLVQSDGRTLLFNVPGNKGVTWQSVSGFDGSLSLADDGTIQWVMPDESVWSFIGSYPVALQLPDGTGLTLTYQNQRLHSVTDDLGAMLQYNYTEGRRDLMRYSPEHDGTQPGHLACLQLPDGSGVRYSYDKRSNLVGVTHADGVDWRYEYNDARFPSHLTRGARSAMNLGAAHGCNDEFASDASKKAFTQDVISYEGTWEYHEDGRASAWRQGDRSVLVDFDVSDSGYGASVERGHSTVVRDSSQMRSYRYDFLADDDANGRKGADIYVKECEGCNWDRLVLMESRSAESVAPVKKPTTQESPAHPSRNSLHRQLRNELVRRGVHAGESRFGSVLIDESSVSSINSKESWKDLTTIDALKEFDTARTNTLRHNNHNFFDFMKLIHTIDHPIQPKPPGTCPLPSGMTCTQIEEAMVYAELSDCAYDSSSCPSDWDIVDPADLGLSSTLLDFGAYHAVILHNPTTNEFVVAFEGTNGISPSDWVSNIQNYYNTTSPLHYNYAADAAIHVNNAIATQYPNASLTFTGHSLGGGAASIAALAVSAPAVVFNPAAVSEHTLHENNINILGHESLIDVINVSGDPVTHFQADNDWPALGTHYTIGNHGVDPNIPSHYLDTVHLELDQIHRDNCP